MSETKKYPNETIRVQFERASCRSFADKKIPKEVMDYILEAGLRAATGGNIQPYSIIKIEDQKAKERLVELNEGQSFIAEAPVNLLFCIDWHRIERWAALGAAPFTATSSFRHFWISFQDTIICAQSICTAADSFGLGSVYVGTVLECFRELKDMLELPDGVLPVVLLSMGYRKSALKQRRKLGIEAMVHDEKYHELEDSRLIELFEDKYPGVRYSATDNSVQSIRKVCREVGGKKLEDECLGRIKEKGYINQAQRQFGLHYVANEMPQRNDDYLKIMEEYGFKWFKKFVPFKVEE
ncbi:MAG: nitroreductase family protein [Caulobacteraceae bacterium]